MQHSFAGGELSPSLYARTDLAKYSVSAAFLRNWFVDYRGGASTRPGTIFVGRCLVQGKAVRLLPFQFSTTQTYALEFGDLYMRIIKDGGYVLEPSKTITAITNASPGVITSNAHGFLNGDWVQISGVLGMTQINSLTGNMPYAFIVANKSANTFQVTDLDGNAINTTAFGVYTSGGTASRIATIVSPYAAADLALLKFTQSADTMTLTHPSYQPRNLTRSTHYTWTFTAITLGPLVNVPTSGGITAINNPGGTQLDYYYVVTALTDVPVEESRPLAAVTTQNAPLNQSTGVAMQISWSFSGGANPTRFNIYKANPVPTGSQPPTVFGLIGQSLPTHMFFYDTNIAPDFTQTPPVLNNPFASNNWPGVTCYFDQRQIYAASTANPETFWASQPGDFKNFDIRFPSQDDDSITGTLASQQVNAIEFMVPMPSGLIALSSGGAWQISGGAQGSSFTPASATATPQAFNGCNYRVPPVTINYDILYVQSKGSIVRDLAYNFYVNIYTGTDLTVLSNHLFFGYQINEWAWAEEPFKLLWCVRNDGILLTMTYLKEQEVYGWAHHDTNGTFQSVVSIPESTQPTATNNEDAVYFVTQRTIVGVNGGSPVQYVELLAGRNFNDANGLPDVTLPWCVDCGLQLSGTPSTTISGLNHLNGATVSILGDGNVFPQAVVANGTIVLSQPCSLVTIGVPYQCQLKTLKLDTGEPTSQDKYKKLTRVTARVENTRGLKWGTSFDKVVPFKMRGPGTPPGTAIPLDTGDEGLNIDALWDRSGQVCYQVDDPLPASLLGQICWVTQSAGG